MAENEGERVAVVEPHAKVSEQFEGEESSIDLVVLYRRLRSGKRTIMGVAFGALVIGAVVAFAIPIRYTSTVSFIPPTLSNGSNSMASALAGQLASLGGGELLGGSKSPGDLYSGILRSRSIADQLIQRYHLMEVYRVKKQSQAEKIIGSDTAVAVDPKSSIVTVEVSAKNPELARDLASGYMDALRDTNGRLALGQSSQRRLFFEQQLAKEKDDLEDAEVELKRTEEQSGLIAPTGQTEAEIKTIADTQAQIAIREVELAALRESATEQNPNVIRLRSEIGDLQGQLSQLQRGKSSASMAAIPTSKVPELQLDYVRKEREVKYHEALFDMLSRQYEAARLDESRDAPVLQVLDPASYPDFKSSPRRSYVMAGGLFLGLVGGCIWVLVRERVHAIRAALASGETA